MAKVKHQTPEGFEKIILDGGRVTYNPNEKIRAAHKRFLKNDGELEYRDPGLDVMEHLKRSHTFYFKTDLASAFDQVTFERLWAVDEGLGINFNFLKPKLNFFHEEGEGGLIQGSLASSRLFEIYCRFSGFDFELKEYCEKFNFHYSRCADDLLVSSSRRFGWRVGPKIRQIVRRYGFALNDRKTRRVNTLEEPLEVLGYTILGTRLDPKQKTLQKLYSPKGDSESRTGVRKWRKGVRNLNRGKGAGEN